jgi:Flp pilus assembly protein TadD
MTAIEQVLQQAFREHQAGHLGQAEQLYRRVLQAAPRQADALHLLGVLMAQRGRDDLAVSFIEEALKEDPDVAAFHNNLGFSYQALGSLIEAKEHFLCAIRLQPDFAMPHNNLGNIYRSQGDTQSAAQCYSEAIRRQPDYAEAHGNLGVIFQELGQFDNALRFYEEALRFNPQHVEAHHNRAMLRLALGDWDRGWPEFEWRWRTKELAASLLPYPRWDGSALAGRTILLNAEQGLGDTMQFIRYVALVKQRGGNVVVECQEPLLQLLQSFPGIDYLGARGQPIPAFHVHAPLLSLPGILNTTVNNVPADVPYLHADPALIKRWKSAKCGLPSAVSSTSSTPHSALRTPYFLIGIAWQGNPQKPLDSQRSIPLVKFAPLAQVPGVRLISLQKGPGTEQLQVADCGFRIEKPEGAGHDEVSGPFIDTAAILRNLDLVVTSDTAVVHLAGALSVPVWVGLPFAADWRWLVGREDCPWYPSMRLFRQPSPGDWNAVFTTIADELRTIVGCQKRA